MQIEDLFLVAGSSDQSLQTLVNRIASCGLWGLIIPAHYTGTDTFVNPHNIAIIDLRTNVDGYSVTNATTIVVGVGFGANAQAGDSITVQGIALII